MYCSACGAQLTDGVAHCAACSRPVGSTPPGPAEGRIAGHIRMLGILWLALSGFRLVPGLILMLLFGGAWSIFPSAVPPFVPAILMGIGGLLSLSAVAGIVTGWGLLAREPWARIMAIVMGCLGLMDLPFGTALGVYTLWVLLPAGSEKEYERLGAAGTHLAGQASR